MKWQHLLLLLAVLSAGACAELLGFPKDAPRPFEHRAHVLQGIHCLTCHKGIEATGDKGPLHLPGTAECRSCHQKPHDERDCNGCHGRTFARDGAARARETLRFEHQKHVSRMDGDCVRCHVDIARDAAVLRPRMATCLGCHEHREQMDTKSCQTCHEDLRSEGTMPDDHLVHDGDFARTHGTRAASERELCATCHSERFCTNCHGGMTAPLPPGRLTFDDPSKPGMHRAGFLSRHAEEARGDPGLCTTCHAPEGCADCHAREGVGAGSGGKSPHPSGWLGLRGQPNDHGRAAWRDPALCASCHGGAGEMLCVGCHRVSGPGGNPHAPGWSSPMRPRVDRPCRLCHEVGP